MDSKFDIEAFGDERKVLINMAKCAEASERYEDMGSLMKKLVQNCKDQLDIEERNLLSVAYKNVIGGRRASWREISNEIKNASTGLHTGQANLEIYKKQIESEIDAICHEILDLLKNNLIKSDGNAEEQVFFLKMAGDYYRYLAESINTAEHKDQTREYYQKAWDLCQGGDGKDGLQPTHPIRLGLALNFSVCHYEILKNKENACELAKKAFDAAIAELDQLKEEDYKDSTLIMQLLRDNLTLWTATEDEPEEQLEVTELS